MIILYILGGLFLFLIILLMLMLFVRLRFQADGVYRERSFKAGMTVYWIKYVLGAHCHLSDLHTLHVRLWILGVPVPFRIPLQVGGKDETNLNVPEPHFKKNDEEHKTRTVKKSDSLQRLHLLVERSGELWRLYADEIKRIFVKYITLSAPKLQARLGFRDPALTGEAAAIYYIIKTYNVAKKTSVDWDFSGPLLEFVLRVKMTMRLYGIFLTLLQIYWKYKRIQKHESE
jgi:hypothetical protein